MAVEPKDDEEEEFINIGVLKKNALLKINDSEYEIQDKLIVFEATQYMMYHAEQGKWSIGDVNGFNVPEMSHASVLYHKSST